ncbi:unnamed protein product [Schistosoma margrebowiei]|uniref:Uncharacterized protein n=1 Tax=Schistosoma margrebowiei TaxID=48269 RepID=A0A183MV64_9TREM|nr:unnamed protein product [Schistosoma margrebowiei]
MIEQTALQRFSRAFLRHADKVNELKITLNDSLQTLQDLQEEQEEMIMEDNWKEFREALTSTCQEVLGCKKHHHKEWFSMEKVNKK